MATSDPPTAFTAVVAVSKDNYCVQRFSVGASAEIYLVLQRLHREIVALFKHVSALL